MSAIPQHDEQFHSYQSLVRLIYASRERLLAYLSRQIPQDLYEVASMDGASKWRQFLKITLPLLQPTSFFVLLVSTVTAVCGSQTFDLIYVMTKGGPANTTSLAI